MGSSSPGPEFPKSRESRLGEAAGRGIPGIYGIYLIYGICGIYGMLDPQNSAGSRMCRGAPINDPNQLINEGVWAQAVQGRVREGLEWRGITREVGTEGRDIAGDSK